MSTDTGREEILNPQGRTPIMKYDCQSYFFAEQINARVIQYVNNELKSSDVVQMFDNVKKEIASFHERVSSDLTKMEKKWIESRTEEATCKLPKYTDLADPDIPTASVDGVAALNILGRDAKKKKKIDAEYKKCHDSIRNLIYDAFESSYGCDINNLIDKVTKDMLPKRLHALQKMIQQLSKSREDILENRESLVYLSKKVKAMEESTSDLKVCIMMQKGML